MEASLGSFLFSTTSYNRRIAHFWIILNVHQNYCHLRFFHKQKTPCSVFCECLLYSVAELVCMLVTRLSGEGSVPYFLKVSLLTPSPNKKRVKFQINSYGSPSPVHSLFGSKKILVEHTLDYLVSRQLLVLSNVSLPKENLRRSSSVTIIQDNTILKKVEYNCIYSILTSYWPSHGYLSNSLIKY